MLQAVVLWSRMMMKLQFESLTLKVWPGLMFRVLGTQHLAVVYVPRFGCKKLPYSAVCGKKRRLHDYTMT